MRSAPVVDKRFFVPATRFGAHSRACFPTAFSFEKRILPAKTFPR